MDTIQCQQGEEPQQSPNEARKLQLGWKCQRLMLFCASPLLISSRVLVPSIGTLVTYRPHKRATQLHHVHDHWDPALCTTAVVTFPVRHRTTTTQVQSCSG